MVAATLAIGNDVKMLGLSFIVPRKRKLYGRNGLLHVKDPTNSTRIAVNIKYFTKALNLYLFIIFCFFK